MKGMPPSTSALSRAAEHEVWYERPRPSAPSLRASRSLEDSFEAGALKMGIFPHSRAVGEVLETIKPISEEHGFMALFLASEGNRIPLNSMT